MPRRSGFAGVVGGVLVALLIAACILGHRI
jgi:hypothetical protein